MFVIEVIPLRRGISVESLSYYSAFSYKIGSLITIPLRNKEITAVVTATKPVSAAKTALKTATFSLRKLTVQKNVTVLPQSLLDTATEMSTLIPASIGALLFAMLPPQIRTGERMYPACAPHTNDEDSTPKVLTATCEDRYIAYKSLIRQVFAHRGSILFVVPSSAEVETAKAKLKGGIENRVITFSATQSKKELRTAFEEFEDLRQAKLIITTPSYAFLDRHDITTFIVESAGSFQYHLRNRPYFDIREVLKIYAKKINCSIILGDIVLKTEDEVQRRNDSYTTFNEHTMRLSLQSTIVLSQHKKIQDGEKFSLFTDESIEGIERTLANHGHIFVHASRRGLAPMVVCYDCGFVFRCPDSGAPYSLLRTFKDGEEQRWFFSSTSGKKVRAADVCPTCGSWRLREQGIGIQTVFDQIRHRFPETGTFLFDHITATTHAKAKKIVQDFYDTRLSILIGTNMVLPYLTKKVDTTIVTSYEALRTVPTWRADELIFSQLLQLREVTAKDVIVQLRTEPDELLELSSRGFVEQFYNGEIEVRHMLAYPPFSVFILLSWQGTKEQVQEIETMVRKSLSSEEVSYYSAPQSTASKTLRHGLIRIEQSRYPKKTLIDLLRTFPPYIKIEINPERIV